MSTNCFDTFWTLSKELSEAFKTVGIIQVFVKIWLNVVCDNVIIKGNSFKIEFTLESTSRGDSAL